MGEEPAPHEYLACPTRRGQRVGKNQTISPIRSPPVAQLILEELAGRHRRAPLLHMSFQVFWVNGLSPALADRPLGGPTRVFLPVAIDKGHGAICQSGPSKRPKISNHTPKFPFLPLP